MRTTTLFRERTAGFIPNDDYTAALSALLREGSWYFSGSGMVIFSSLYEISSYAAGIIQFEIPYSELAGHIDEVDPGRDHWRGRL